MSRIAESDGDCWNDCEDECRCDQIYEESIRNAYRADGEVREKLIAFLAYLDAMPVKKVITNRFMRPRDGAMCAVGAFVASAGASLDELRAIEKKSRWQRMWNYQGLEDSWSGGATVAAGTEYGLPEIVALDLAGQNDIIYDRVSDEERWHKIRAYVARRLQHDGVSV